MPITLRPQQIAGADAAEQAFREGVTRPLLDMCVAAGKSFTFAELARREVARGGRVIIGAHVRELVAQNADACKLLTPETQIGINAAALGERTWRAPIISAAIQSVYKYAQHFGPVTLVCVDEAHLVPHSESGMYRELHRALGYPRMVGGSGTTFRLQGGSLVEGEGAPFEKVVYRYTILDGIRDGYLCPAFSIGATEKMDASKLRIRQGEYRSDQQDEQMLAAMDNHIAQMVHHCWADRQRWLVFEASVKAATAMAERMNAWNIPTGLVLGETPTMERIATIDAYRNGRLRALVNVAALTTGFDVPAVDLLVMRRRTKSLGLYIQMAGRGLRAANGKLDCAVLDFAGNIDEHGPLDFIRQKETKPRLVACDECGTRNAGATAKCWHCGATMLKACPQCLTSVPKHVLDCPHCGFDMRRLDAGERKEANLLDMPTGAALIASYKAGVDRQGGWLGVNKAYAGPGGALVDLTDGRRVEIRGRLAELVHTARWARVNDAGEIVALLCPNGAARTSARQVGADGSEFIVPMPSKAA